MKQILIIQLFILAIFANENQKNNILNLSNADIKYIKVNPKKNEIIKRIKNYSELKSDIEQNQNSYSTFKKLSRVNNFFNQILSKTDEESDLGDDIWATRKEFIFKGYGDCEDYAISKYFTLKEFKFDPKKIFMMVVKVKGARTYHMVLGYFKTKDSIPLILDNLSFKVAPLDIRKDLEVKFVFNEFESYLMKDNKLSKRVNLNWDGMAKWQELLDKIYKQNK